MYMHIQHNKKIMVKSIVTKLTLIFVCFAVIFVPIAFGTCVQCIPKRDWDNEKQKNARNVEQLVRDAMGDCLLIASILSKIPSMANNKPTKPAETCLLKVTKTGTTYEPECSVCSDIRNIVTRKKSYAVIQNPAKEIKLERDDRGITTILHPYPTKRRVGTLNNNNKVMAHYYTKTVYTKSFETSKAGFEKCTVEKIRGKTDKWHVDRHLAFEGIGFRTRNYLQPTANYLDLSCQHGKEREVHSELVFQCNEERCTRCDSESKLQISETVFFPLKLFNDAIFDPLIDVYDFVSWTIEGVTREDIVQKMIDMGRIDAAPTSDNHENQGIKHSYQMPCVSISLSLSLSDTHTHTTPTDT